MELTTHKDISSSSTGNTNEEWTMRVDRGGMACGVLKTPCKAVLEEITHRLRPQGCNSQNCSQK